MATDEERCADAKQFQRIHSAFCKDPALLLS
jgi:hypothetical protein